jgi:hypothetical protein
MHLITTLAALPCCCGAQPRLHTALMMPLPTVPGATAIQSPNIIPPRVGSPPPGGLVLFRNFGALGLKKSLHIKHLQNRVYTAAACTGARMVRFDGAARSAAQF